MCPTDMPAPGLGGEGGETHTTKMFLFLFVSQT
jgi:hypothetical protein